MGLAVLSPQRLCSCIVTTASQCLHVCLTSVGSVSELILASIVVNIKATEGIQNYHGSHSLPFGQFLE